MASVGLVMDLALGSDQTRAGEGGFLGSSGNGRVVAAGGGGEIASGFGAVTDG
jgi:hypothetical protein